MTGFLLGLALGAAFGICLKMAWVWSNGYNAGCLDTTVRLTGYMSGHG